MAVTFSPDPVHLAAGAGTAAQQTAQPRLVADLANGGWDPVATGATAGSPGTYTPAGAAVPANLAALSGVTASPATKWTVGQHIITADNQHAYWTATAWASGDAPAAQQQQEKRGK